MKKIAWLTLTLLMVAALVLSSCQAATVEEEKETETVTGKVTEKGAATAVEEEEEEVVVAEAGPEMVRDIKGRLVEKPQYGGTVTISVDGNPTSWDPAAGHTGGAGYMVNGSMYDVLLGGDWSIDRSVNPYTAVYIPPEATIGFSAESYENPDPLTYIVHLRQGMRWQNKPPVNGREVTAEDLKYTVERGVCIGEFEGASHDFTYHTWELVESIEVMDKYTCVIKLKEPFALFTEYWGCEWMPWIHPREVVETHGYDYTWEQAVGHGPWQIADVVIDGAMTFEKHPNYYGIDDNFPENNIPYADRLKVLLIQDWSTRLAALRTGKIDQIGMGWEDAKTLKETDPQLLWVDRPNTCRVVDLNMGIEPYSDVRVRKAMQMAINLEELAATYYGGTADPWPYMGHKSFPAYYAGFDEMPADVQEAFTFDPEGAKDLLTAAGYPNGFKQEMPLSGPWDLADLFIAYWEGIGIETEIRLMEGAAYSDFIYSGNADMVWIWSCGYWMPTQIYEYWYGGQETVPWNFSNANDPVFNQYRKDILANPDAAERTRLIKEGFIYGVGQYFYTAGPVQVANVAWQPWLKGYQGEDRITSVAFGPTWARVWVDQDLKYEMTGKRD